VVEAENVTPRPAGVLWPVAGSLFVAGTTAYAVVRAVSASSGDTVVVAGAAGGVGSITVQLARLAGAEVIGLAGKRNHEWLRDLGVLGVEYGEGVEQRIRDATGGAVDAFIDLAGGYVEMALELGVKPERIDTVVDFGAGQKYGVKTEGTAAAANAGVLAELAAMIDEGRLDVPIARVYPLEQVREAFRELEQGHTRGKLVLEP
jgi:NADPH:quinone reductase-like Zn-dependent oxidoreductase